MRNTVIQGVQKGKLTEVADLNRDGATELIRIEVPAIDNAINSAISNSK